MQYGGKEYRVGTIGHWVMEWRNLHGYFPLHYEVSHSKKWVLFSDLMEDNTTAIITDENHPRKSNLKLIESVSDWNNLIRQTCDIMPHDDFYYVQGRLFLTDWETATQLKLIL